MNDPDHDGVCHNIDNCTATPNADQQNIDGDSKGDACDSDIDGDGLDNDDDVCDYGPFGAPIKNDGQPIGDNDEDCDLDLIDYQGFVACINGPNTPPQQFGCREVFNVDSDMDIDLVDFANFQHFYTGE